MNSPTTRPVAVGVDGLPGSAGALRYAVAEAARRSAPLRLVHVVPEFVRVGPPVPMTDVRRYGRTVLERSLAAARAAAGPDLVIDSVLVHGERHRGVVEGSADAQLLVVGRETRHGLERLVAGASTARIASRAACDVVVVPSFWTPDHPQGRVVVGLKSRDNAHELLAGAFAEASARAAQLRVVVAWEVPDPYFDRVELRTHAAEWEAHGVALADEVTAELRRTYPDVPVETRVVHGSPAKVLLAEAADSDLLVISRRRIGLPPYGHLGGVGHSVLRLSEVPVHVVPCADRDGSQPPDLALETAGQPVG